MRRFPIYRLLLLAVVAVIGPRSHVKALNVDLCCILTCGISRCCKSDYCSGSNDDKDEEIVASCPSNVTWKLKFDSSTCIIKMKKKEGGSSQNTSSKSQPNSGTGQSQPDGTPTTPTSPPSQSSPTNLTGTDGSANPNSNNNNGSQSQTTPGTPSTPSTPSTLTTPSGTSSSKSCDELQIVQNPYEHTLSLNFNGQITHLEIKWFNKDVLKYEKAEEFPLALSLRLTKSQALVLLKDGKYNGHVYDKKAGKFDALGSKDLAKYELKDIKFLRDSSNPTTTTNTTSNPDPNNNNNNSTSTKDSKDSVTTSQNEVDTSQMRLLKFPFALLYKLSEGSNCSEITCKGQRVWKKGHRGLEEHPVAAMFTLYRQMCYIYFKDVYLVFEIRSGWEEAVTVQAVRVDDNDLKFVQTDGSTSSDMDDSKFQKNEQDHVIEYIFKDGANCSQVKWKDKAVWSIDNLEVTKTATSSGKTASDDSSTPANQSDPTTPTSPPNQSAPPNPPNLTGTDVSANPNSNNNNGSQSQDNQTTPSTPSTPTSPSTTSSTKYPTRISINRYMKTLTVQFNHLWYYCYSFDGSRWELFYKQEDGSCDPPPEQPSYFTGEEVDLKQASKNTNTGSTPPTST